MKHESKKIHLTRLANDSRNLIRSMAQELQGVASGKVSGKPQWGTRFVAAGPKSAPPRH